MWLTEVYSNLKQELFFTFWCLHSVLYIVIKEKENQLNIMSLPSSEVLIRIFVGSALLMEIRASINPVLIISTSNHLFGRSIWYKLPSAFLKILILPEQNEKNFRFFKNHEGFSFQKILNETCDYWLIAPNQLTLCTETNIFQQRAANYKITPLTVQCHFTIYSVITAETICVINWKLHRNRKKLASSFKVARVVNLKLFFTD